MMTPEEAAQRRDRLIDLGYLVETPALRAYKTIAGMTWEYAVQVCRLVGPTETVGDLV